MQNRLIITSLRFGLYGGLAIILYFLILYFYEYDPLDKKLFFFKYIVLVLCILAGIKIYRDKWNNNTLHLWEGLLCGLMINITIALFSAIFVYLFLTFIDGEMLGRHIDEVVQWAESNKHLKPETMSEDSFRELISRTKETTIFDIALDDFEMYFIGIFFIFITAVLLRK